MISLFQKGKLELQPDALRYVVMLIIGWAVFSVALSFAFVFGQLEHSQDVYTSILKGVIIFTCSLIVGVSLIVGSIILVLKILSK